MALPVDVTDRASLAAFLDEAERQLGPLDVVVNNAGIMPVTPVRRGERGLDPPPDRHQRARRDRRHPDGDRADDPRGSGHIVNLASQAGKGGLPGIATYSATKHAVVGLCEAVRAELRGSGVEMHCVMPTVVNTELTSGVGQRWVKPVEAEDVADAIVEALEVGRYDVWVPKENGAIYRIMMLIPRGAREAIGRFMKVDKLMTEVDHGARNAYEERARIASRVSRRARPTAAGGGPAWRPGASARSAAR